MAAIGGYFGLELRKGRHFHEDALRFNSARNCLDVILQARKWKSVFLPFYTCEAILQPIVNEGIDYRFYRIDSSFNPVDLPALKKDEAIIYTNYFGLKQTMVEELANKYADQLIVDNAQAFFSPRVPGIDTFYSPRKFFGVPDGGYLYSDLQLSMSFDQDHSSWSRMTHLCRRIDEGPEMGYAAYRHAEDSLDYAPIKTMSELTELILGGIDYDAAMEARRNNFSYYHRHLIHSNRLRLDFSEKDVPMCYPFLTKVGMRERLLDAKVYIPFFWRNVTKWCTDGFEGILADGVLALPSDQRYGQSEIERVITIIKQ